MVGLPCSGKSTLARTLEHEHSALRLTPDEWQLRLFGQDAEAPEHNARHTLIETLQWEVASRALVGICLTVERTPPINERLYGLGSAPAPAWRFPPWWWHVSVQYLTHRPNV